MQLTGHKILITGGSAGIGLALTRALFQQGKDILVVPFVLLNYVLPWATARIMRNA